MLASRHSRAAGAPASRASTRASAALARVSPGGAPRAVVRRTPIAPLRAAAGGGGGGDWFSTGKAKFFEMLAGSYDAAAVNSYIDAQIKENAVVVFSWTTCPYCIKAKRELEATGARFTALEINTMENGKAIKAELAKRTGRTSVPQIWVKGEFIGGCNDGPKPGYGVASLAASGALVPMLKAAGAL